MIISARVESRDQAAALRVGIDPAAARRPMPKGRVNRRAALDAPATGAVEFACSNVCACEHVSFELSKVRRPILASAAV